MTEMLVQHVDTYVGIGLVGIAEAQQKSDGIQVPLQLFELDAAFVEYIAHEYVYDDHPQQQEPYVGDTSTNMIRQAV